MVGVFGPNATPRPGRRPTQTYRAAPLAITGPATYPSDIGGCIAAPSISWQPDRGWLMSEAPPSEPTVLAERLTEFAERSQHIVEEFWRTQAETSGEAGYSVADPR